MQIELIAPVSTASASLPRLGLGILAALTPPSDEVIYTDEVVAPFDLARDVKDVDLVGISVDSKTARRSYDIADAYRARGVPVVLGGIHATACPEEASAHADAVVVGEAEDLWPSLVEDARARRLHPIYRPPLPDLTGKMLARRDLFRGRRYIPFEVVQTMRGCPYPCEFCSVSTANGTTMRFRPADDVLSELAALGKLIMFADDNVMIHRAYAKDLFTRMIPLRKHWIGQCSLAAVRRLENVQLMAASGCKALFVGFESIDEETTRYTGKKQNRPSEYKETVHMLREHGISVWGSFVFGFDTDDPEVFERTAEFAIEMQLTMANFSMLVSVPGYRALSPTRGRGATHRSAVVAARVPRRGGAALRSQAALRPAAARGLGTRLAPVLFLRLDVEAVGRTSALELDPARRLLAAQHDAAPRHPGPRGARRRRVGACLTSRAAPR